MSSFPDYWPKKYRVGIKYYITENIHVIKFSSRPAIFVLYRSLSKKGVPYLVLK